MKRLKRFICTIVGHRWDVEGVTGRYQWCSRCALRREKGSRLGYRMEVTQANLERWARMVNCHPDELREGADEWLTVVPGDHLELKVFDMEVKRLDIISPP